MKRPGHSTGPVRSGCGAAAGRGRTGGGEGGSRSVREPSSRVATTPGPAPSPPPPGPAPSPAPLSPVRRKASVRSPPVRAGREPNHARSAARPCPVHPAYPVHPVRDEQPGHRGRFAARKDLRDGFPSPVWSGSGDGGRRPVRPARWTFGLSALPSTSAPADTAASRPSRLRRWDSLTRLAGTYQHRTAAARHKGQKGKILLFHRPSSIVRRRSRGRPPSDRSAGTPCRCPPSPARWRPGPRAR